MPPRRSARVAGAKAPGAKGKSQYKQFQNISKAAISKPVGSPKRAAPKKAAPRVSPKRAAPKKAADDGFGAFGGPGLADTSYNTPSQSSGPRNTSDDKKRAYRRSSGAKVSKEGAYDFLKNGGTNARGKTVKGRPSFNQYSEDQRWAVINYIRGKTKK